MTLLWSLLKSTFIPNLFHEVFQVMSALLYVPFCLHYCFVNIVELFITLVPFCIFLVWSLSAAVQVEIKRSLFPVLLQWVHKMLIHAHKKKRRSAKICSFIGPLHQWVSPHRLACLSGLPNFSYEIYIFTVFNNQGVTVLVAATTTISRWTELQRLCSWCHLKHFWCNIIWHKKIYDLLCS